MFKRLFLKKYILFTLTLIIMLSLVSLLVADIANARPYCILRKPAPALGPPNRCFEFYLCDIGNRRMCQLGANGQCQVTPLGQRSRFTVDPSAHPPITPGPYNTWEGADYVMTVLSPYGGDWYQCFGRRTMNLPQRVPTRDGGTQPGYCILRKPAPGIGPPDRCFEFYLANTSVTRRRMAVIQGGQCFVTNIAARQGFIVDPNLGGPYNRWRTADAAVTRLSPYGGDFYGCFRQPTPPTPSPPPPTPPPPHPERPKQEWLSDAEAKALQKELWDTYNKKWCDEWCTHRPKRTKGKVNWSGCAEEPLRALKVLSDMAWWARTREKQGIVRRLAACYDPCVMKDISPQDRARCYKDCKDRNPMPK